MVETIDVHDLPEEEAILVQKFVNFLKKQFKTKRPTREKQQRKTAKIDIYLFKADTLLKHAGILAFGGDAVIESRYYDE